MLNISGNANKVLDGRTLNNGGTLNWSGAGDIDLSNSAVINNLAGATFNIQNDETLFATGTVTNAGLLTKTGGIGTTTIESGVTFSNNGGSVTVQSGTLRFDGTYVQNSGSTTVGAGAVLLTGGRTNILGGTFGGRGSITGNVSKSGTVSPGASPGVLTINGNYEQTAIGTLAIEITGVDGAAFDQLHVLGTATLAGTLEIFRPGGFEPAQGDAFLILTFTSRNGSFATTNGTAINGSISFQPNLGANDLTLDVVNNSPIADLSISITDTPDPVTAGSSFAYTAVITNQGPNDVTNVTLTDPLPAGVSLRAATSTHGICTGTVVISCALGTLHPGETAVVTMVVMPGAAGELINTVTVESDITDSEPADNSAFAVTMVAAAPPADVTGPRVVALEQVPASSTTIRQIVLTVDEALRNASVLPIGNYTLRSAGRDGVFETADDKNMPLVSAEYDPDFLTIALTPRKPLKLNQLLQLTVKGTGGVTDRASNPLDGDSNGTPGGDFVRRFTSSLPIRTAASRSTRTAVAAATDLILEMAGSSPTRVHESESLHGTAPRAEWSSCRAALSRRR
jgi:uncharacterized repeat protein (TIGR01451 family)